MELYNKENASPTIMNAFDVEFEKGIEQGITQERHTIAKNLLLKNIPVETIAETTGLTLDEIKRLKKALN